MNTKTQKLTFGAMIVAIFGVLLLINRQSGGIFEDFLFFIFPIPLVAFSAKYGLKSSISVFICTVLLTFFCGSYTAVFYAISQSFIGMVFGVCLYHKKDPGKIVVLIMTLCAISSIVSYWLLLSISGISVGQDLSQVQTMMNGMIDEFGTKVGYNEQILQSMKTMLTADNLRRIMFVGLAFTGVIQGIVIYWLSLLILRRLRFKVQRPKPLADFYPPKWSGVVSLIAFAAYMFTYVRPLQNDIAQNVVQTLGICGMMYLLCFGMFSAYLMLRVRFNFPKIFAIILPLIFMGSFSYLYIILGFVYIRSEFHDWVLNRIA